MCVIDFTIVPVAEQLHPLGITREAVNVDIANGLGKDFENTKMYI